MCKLNLYAWGANNYGQLANGQPCEQLERPFLLHGIDLDPETVLELGGGHTLLINRHNRVYAAGWNNKGQCGVGSKQDLCEFSEIEDQQFTQVAAGWDFSLGIDLHGAVFGCGSNAFGQLGLDKQVKDVKVFTRLDIKEKVRKIAAGMRHSLFLLEDGTLKVCGSGRKGQLCMLTNSNIFTLQNVSFEKKVVDIFAGQNFSVLLFSDGSFQAFGDDKHGQVKQLNDYSMHKDIHLIQLGWTHVIMLLKSGNIEAFGRSDYGQISGRDSVEKFTQVSSGYEHCLAISDKGQLFAWGWNEHGNCGLGHTTDIKVPTKVFDGCVIKCFAGSGHSFALVQS